MTETFALQCNDCEHLFNHDDVESPLYSCSRCGSEFTRSSSMDGDSNRCPNCNIFAAKEADITCPECESGDVEEGEFSPPPPPSEEELAAQSEQRKRSEEDMRIMATERERERAAVWAQWDGRLADAFAVIDPAMPGGLREAFKPDWQSHSYDLSTDHAILIACYLLDVPRPELPPRTGHDERVALVDKHGLRRAYEGIRLHEDLDRNLYQSNFDWQCVSSGIPRLALAKIAERLLEKQSKCPDCGGSGERVLNPDWPEGTDPYSERCSTCSGTGEAP